MMFVVKNLEELASGNIKCKLLAGGTWGEFIMSPLAEYELHDSSEWTEIKPCPQSEKDAQAKLDIIRQAEQTFNETMSPIVNSVSQLERDTWIVQEQEARVWLADPTVEAPFIYMLASSRGVDIETLVHKIIAKADVYSSILAKALGEKHKAEDNV